jgi:hypothetical protein
LLLLGLVVLLVMGTAPPVLSFDAATVERQSSINVTGDGDAIVGLVTTDELTAGIEGSLVNTTNAVGSDVTVTLTLQNRSKGILTNETAQGEELQFALETGATENVSIDLNCDASVDDRIDYRTEVTDPGFRGDLTRSATVTDSACSSRELVFLSTTGLASVTNSDPVTNYDTPSVDYIGPQRVDFDDDGRKENVPFSEAGNVSVADQQGTELLATGARTGRDNNANLWAGSFNGAEPAVYFTQQGDIKRVDRSGVVTEVYGSSDTDIVGGVGDVDSTHDGDELVFTSGGALRYRAASGSVEKTSAFSLADRDALGQPANFDDEGLARVPFVDSSGALRLANLTAETQSEPLDTDVKPSPMASLDYDSDGLPEIVYVSGSGTLKYIDGLGGNTVSVEVVTDGSGDVVKASDTTSGVA